MMPIMLRRESPIPRTNPSGQKVWVARYTGPDGRRRSAGTFKLKREAQDAIDAAYERPELGRTVRAYLPVWQDRWPRSQRTDRTNRGRISNVLDLPVGDDGTNLGDMDMREVRRRHAGDLVALMLTGQGRAPEGARNIVRALSAMFEDAITDELCDSNPWLGVKVRDDDRRAVKRSRETRVWSWEQMHAFAAAARYRPRYRPTDGKQPPASRPAPEYEPMLRMLADCGLRIGELLALVRAEQNLRDGVGTVAGTAWEGQVIRSSETKDHSREFPIPGGALALLRSVPARIDTPWLFPSPGGTLWRYSNWWRQIWQPTCEAAGIDPIPHEFRHSWTTHLRAAGVDPADLADVAGHSLETQTRVYTHPLRRSFDEIRQVIG